MVGRIVEARDVPSQPMGAHETMAEDPSSVRDGSSGTSEPSEGIAENAEAIINKVCSNCGVDNSMQAVKFMCCSIGKSTNLLAYKKGYTQCPGNSACDEEDNLLAERTRRGLKFGDDFPDSSSEAVDDDGIKWVDDGSDLKSNKRRLRWRNFTRRHLMLLSNEEIKQIKQDIEVAVQAISSELVTILQQRQQLQEETDIRHLAIEQLLRAQDRLLWKSSEPLTVNMSVVIPSNSDEQVTRC